MKLSIIVPVYKVELYLRRCIDSILEQTFTDFELILVDDGSPDNCPTICDEYAKIDSRIIVIHKENEGLSAARNAGLDIAKGEYIGFVDSDDFVHSTMYETLYQTATDYEVDIVQCEFMRVYENDTEIISELSGTHHISLYDSSELLHDFFPNHVWRLLGYVWRRIYKRGLFDSIRFPVGRYFEDTSITLSLLEASTSIALIDIPLYYYYIRQNSITQGLLNEKKICDHLEEHLLITGYFKNRSTEQYNHALDTLFRIYSLYKFTNYKEKAQRIRYFRIDKLMRKRYLEFLLNKSICRMKKCAYIILQINVGLAYKLFIKYFPECIPSKYREQL